jgi:hypothetical protein
VLVAANGVDSTHCIAQGAEVGREGFRWTLFEGAYELFVETEGYTVGRAEVVLTPEAGEVRVQFEIEREL